MALAILSCTAGFNRIACYLYQILGATRFAGDIVYITVATSHNTGKGNVMAEDEPYAIYYFRKAAEELEGQMTGPVYYLAKGLLRLAESLAAQMDKESTTGAVDAPTGH
jgi:hypothetical protein